MKIRLFTPSSPGLEKEIKHGLKILWNELGAVVPGLEIEGAETLKECLKPNPELDYIAGDDAEKAAQFQDICGRQDLDFVLCSRGGYGALRWLDLVDWQGFSPSAPQFIGFSDVTNIFSPILDRGGRALHGPMLNSLASTARQSRLALWKFMADGKLAPLAGTGIGDDACFEGKLIGGNLACLCHLIGTSFEPIWQDRILLLEDCNEPPYKLDRMLTHLELAGVFKKIGGLALGQFTGMEEEDYGILLERIIRERASRFDFPVVWNLPCGHGRINMPLQLGSYYKIDSGQGMLSPL